jgi:osmotically-inducible protein OsmY
MTPRIWSYGEVDGEDLPTRDRPYESFGQQGFAMPDHDTARGYPPRRGAERIDLGEPMGQTSAGPKNWQRSDERIHDDVCALLADDEWVDASDLEVVVHHGEVTLSGSVSDSRQRARAVRIAEAIRGVVDVVSRLRVKRPETRDGRHRR